jgi:hypothetical protein
VEVNGGRGRVHHPNAGFQQRSLRNVTLAPQRKVAIRNLTDFNEAPETATLSAQSRSKPAGQLEHDPEKWKPVFRKDHAQLKR